LCAARREHVKAIGLERVPVDLLAHREEKMETNPRETGGLVIGNAPLAEKFVVLLLFSLLLAVHRPDAACRGL
jgi:hypothetical protein